MKTIYRIKRRKADDPEKIINQPHIFIQPKDGSERVMSQIRCTRIPSGPSKNGIYEIWAMTQGSFDETERSGLMTQEPVEVTKEEWIRVRDELANSDVEGLYGHTRNTWVNENDPRNKKQK